MTRRASFWLWPVLGIWAVLIAGCATHTAKMAELRPHLAAGRYDAALDLVDDEMGRKDSLLGYLERGLIEHEAGRYQESNESLAAAERTAQELYATSISEGALSLITNDMARSYRARPFELAMVPYYRALNYIHLGQRDDALVEARKASLLLREYVDATIGGIERGETDEFARTRNDPFLLYFSGMLYDWDGAVNDAFIAYRNAAVAYQDQRGLLGVAIPPWLAGDLVRTANHLGFSGELEQLRAACPDVFAGSTASGSWPAGHGELVLLIERGFVAAKGESKLQVPIYKSDDYDDNHRWAGVLTRRAELGRHRWRTREIAYWLSMALPLPPVSQTRDLRIELSNLGIGRVASVPAHHPSATARITHDAEYGTVLMRTVLRALLKYLAFAEVREKGAGFGLLVNLFGAATEVADTRSWLTLPDHIQLLRVSLPAGVHDLELELRDTSGRSAGRVTVPQIQIRAGDWTFVNQRVYEN